MIAKRKPQEKNWFSSNNSTKNAVRVIHIIAIIFYTQENSKRKLYGDLDKTINPIINEGLK